MCSLHFSYPWNETRQMNEGTLQEAFGIWIAFRINRRSLFVLSSAFRIAPKHWPFSWFKFPAKVSAYILQRWERDQTLLSALLTWTCFKFGHECTLYTENTLAFNLKKNRFSYVKTRKKKPRVINLKNPWKCSLLCICSHFHFVCLRFSKKENNPEIIIESCVVMVCLSSTHT